tara:strand:- start:13244 stop:13519 length:276 start_codon:yes stop_codon:yes gene_type:complete
MNSDYKTTIRLMRKLYNEEQEPIGHQLIEAVVLDFPGSPQTWSSEGSPAELSVEDAWVVVDGARGKCITNDLTWEDQEDAIQVHQRNNGGE